MPNIMIRIEKSTDESVEKTESKQLTKNKKDKSDVAITTIFTQQMISYAKQTLSFAVSNVGNFTGNYIQQDILKNQLDAIGDVSTIALGFVAKGPIGGSIAIAGLLIKNTFELVNSLRAEQVAERDLNLLQKRSGNSTTNSSRGTEN